MVIQMVAILAFAALFAGFLLLNPMRGRGGCHSCAGRDRPGGCEEECPLLRDRDNETLSETRSV